MQSNFILFYKRFVHIGAIINNLSASSNCCLILKIIRQKIPVKSVSILMAGDIFKPRGAFCSSERFLYLWLKVFLCVCV